MAPPYTPLELELSALMRLSSPRKRARKRRERSWPWALGAGLDGRWVTQVRAVTCRVDGDVVVVTVGGPSARTVPVLRLWEDEVLSWPPLPVTSFSLGAARPRRNRASSLTASLVVPPGHPRLSAARLRSTWLLWHLKAGTRLPELAVGGGSPGCHRALRPPWSWSSRCPSGEADAAVARRVTLSARHLSTSAEVGRRATPN